MILRFDQLWIHNFRCFSDCTVTFHPELTILVADNGRGKTTVLDAAATALAPFVEELTLCRQSDGILQSDVRLERDKTNNYSPRTPTQLKATAAADNIQLQWTCERKQFDKRPRRSPKALSELLAVISELRARVSTPEQANQGAVLPVVAYYGSNRFSDNGYFRPPPRKKPFKLDDRMSGYRIFLDPLSDSLHFNKWYRKMVTAVKKHPVIGVSRSDSPLRQLTAVRAAVESVLGPTGWGQIDWDESRQCVVAEHPVQGRIPLASLSSGVRSMIALTADLAHRCARLNPGLGEDVARATPGVVLIDEVDLHLHPGWQQMIVGLLRGAFPQIQFILSTHSPQVLSAVNAESIRVIKLCDGDGQIETPIFQTRGVVSADVLNVIMGVDPVPRVEEAEMLNRFRAKVEDGTHENEEGRELRKKLVGHFGEQHPLIIDCDRLIRFVTFKRRTAKGGA